ncbi:Zinc finger CCCH domain-containing protein 17 [Zea mays]|uniref:Zinc finger CCCH domain-containing protein 17 n=1 Tax=Zea mays TaxID=4577 RepID=A0A3L6FIJ0_MAIZE|nr:Zinc finger CCCH domain-containing protein 17 [Zea mays]
MPISSTLATRLRTGHSSAPKPARRSPYTRPKPSGGAKASRPSPRLDPATTRPLEPSQKAVRSGLGRRAEPDVPDARAAESKPKLAHGDDRPPLEEKRRCSGEGGFVFLCALAGHTEAIGGISLPSGSNKLYSGSVDGSVRIWDCNSGKCVDVIKMGRKVSCMITHGPWVLIGIPKFVEAWNTKTGMKLRFQGPSSLVCSMAITDEMLFAGTGDGRIMAWRFPAKESNTEPVLILSGHQRPVISLSISARRLYSGSLDKTIKAWDLTTRQCVQTLSEHKAAVTSVLCWDEKLLSCSLDKTVKLWTLSESGNLQVKYTHAEENGLRTLFGMHRVGKTPVLLCSLHNSNRVRLLDLPSFDGIGTLLSTKEVRTIELAAGGLLFTGDCSGELKVWRWAPKD